MENDMNAGDEVNDDIPKKKKEDLPYPKKWEKKECVRMHGL